MSDLKHILRVSLRTFLFESQDTLQRIINKQTKVMSTDHEPLLVFKLLKSMYLKSDIYHCCSYLTFSKTVTEEAVDMHYTKLYKTLVALCGTFCEIILKEIERCHSRTY